MELTMEDFKMTPEDGDPRKRRLQINFAAICIMWLFSFTAYSGLQNLESSLNPCIGVYSLAALTGGGLISCLLAPAVISYISGKGALIISWISLMIFVGANYYPRSFVLIPGAAIEGLATGLMWTAQGAIVTSIAVEYAEITGGSFEDTLSKMFGIFCAAFQSTQIWGNLLSSTVLGSGGGPPPLNTTIHVAPLCGKDNCPKFEKCESKTSFTEDRAEIILISAYMGFAFIGLLVTIFMLGSDKKVKQSPEVSLLARLGATGKLLFTNANMAMLVPFSLWTGLEQTIMYAEFTKAFVACELGIHWIGYTMICFGALNTVGSPLSGLLAKYIGRPVLFLIATLLNLGALSGMYFWEISSSQKIIFFVIPAVWGLADSIWQTQSAALVGSAFVENQEPAFSNLRMFQALGFTVGYLYSNHLCESIKMYIVAGELIVSMLLVAIVEIRLRTAKQVSGAKVI
ncbi:hypothetical protein FSP39_006661 [Pinctada imbricata]|uniref:Protein unc-93 homolog A n=1 Tax=Pinctada imbricata TaxID=66713 RepID=A0AA89BK43_PINIB|nr:hypothetical protein FSP39_006661 [Pinctada imbricata]